MTETKRIETMGTSQKNQHRHSLPAPMLPRDQISFWSILKNCVGKELYKITMPVVFNEPLTMLQRACESIQYTNILKKADLSDDPIERMELVCAFIIASLSANCHRIIKPFNPLLYETYEICHKLDDGKDVKSISQQVSHHPPITASHSESDYFIYHGSVNPKIKFWGKSMEIQPDGHCRVYLKRHKENYVFKSVSCSVHNIIVGRLWFEHSGPLDITCPDSGLVANMNFKQAGWFGNELHRFEGQIVDRKKNRLRYIYGKWSDYINSVNYTDYEKFLKMNSKKVFKIPDSIPNIKSRDIAADMQNLSIGKPSSQSNIGQSGESSHDISISNIAGADIDLDNKLAQSTQTGPALSIDIPNSRTLWRLEDKYLPDYYNFTQYTLIMNELTPELEQVLPPTDSRFRSDVRRLEEGDLDGAASEKVRLEEKQRANRVKDKRFKDPSADFLWFKYEKVDTINEKFWVYRGGYWESRSNPEKFPDIF